MYLETAVQTHAHLLHYLLVDKFQGEYVYWLNSEGQRVLGKVLAVLPDFDLQVQVVSGDDRFGDVVRVTVKEVLDRSS